MIEYRPDMRLSDIPIPRDVRVTACWPPQLVELAEYIGAYDALILADNYGGRAIYVPPDPERNPFRKHLSREKRDIVTQKYVSQQLEFPIANNARNQARRACVLASVRNGDITREQGRSILSVTRSHLSRLLNHTTEALDAAPLHITARHDPRQTEMFDPETLAR